jgi:predicted dehydrogenase
MGSLINMFLKAAPEFNARITAVCDLWSYHRERTAKRIERQASTAPQQFRNTDELYDGDHVDAVMIATPDFAHAIPCAEAVRQGKDVYVEKPLADTMEDARLVRKACLETGRIVQIGTNLRSNARLQAAAEFVQSGKLGKVNGAETVWHVNQPLRWRRIDRVKLLKEQDTDWKRYLLNRPKMKFDPRKYLEYRLFWPLSSGLPDQWLSHQIDLVHMITGAKYPKSCVASGGLYQWKDGRENPDTFAAIYEYPGGFQVRSSLRQNNDYHRRNVWIYSKGGTLDTGAGSVSGEGGRSEDQRGPGNVLSEHKFSGESGNHVADWLSGIRQGKQPCADIQAGYSHSVAIVMAIRAFQTGKRVVFDAVKYEIKEG